MWSVRDGAIFYMFTQGRILEEIARSLNVPEDKVKMWFVNRRAKERKIQRRVYLENLPTGAEDFIFMTDVEDP
ncbi:hypothetical protein I79_016262 [Cricetulus griseus]|uniref:Homeobox domain-containing protein n=1 Tax=Cricetulus griseus TaxID=10029 RepID=G3HYW9_CRIGR|nr:hypothetical protein I79_016262 [Cricetulus griseus]